MKISIKTFIDEKGDTRIVTDVDFGDSLTNSEISMVVTELEKIKLELLSMWSKTYDFEVEKLENGD